MSFKKNITVFVAFIILVFNTICSEEKKDIGSLEVECIGILALVNGNPITLLDVLRVCSPEESRLPYMFQGRMLEEQIKKLRLEALEEVINRKLVYSDFLSNKFELPKSYIQMYLDKIAESYNVTDQKSLKELVESKGQSYDDFQEEAYENAAVNALVGDRCYTNVFVTPEQIYNYYKDHKNKFVSPEQIEVQILKMKKDGMHRKEIDSLSDSLAESFKSKDRRTFNDAVLMYSEGPETQNGGNIGWIEIAKLRDDFADSVKKLEVGGIAGPVKAEEAYYFLRINNRKTEIVETFNEAKDGIKEELTRAEKKKKYDSYIKKLRDNADIKYFISNE